MSVRYIFPLKKGVSPRPVFVAYFKYQVLLQESNNLELGSPSCTAPDGNTEERCATLLNCLW